MDLPPKFDSQNEACEYSSGVLAPVCVMKVALNSVQASHNSRRVSSCAGLRNVAPDGLETKDVGHVER
jgi:hypothetical protein